jgi:Rrf2 family protein
MMRLSTKGRYGTRAMLELALNEGKGPVLLREIAERQRISVKYLEQITPVLKSAGLINSNRGAGGGYYLARPADRITVKEIVEALEGPIRIVDCAGGKDICSKTDTCVTIDLWDEVSRKISGILESKNLRDLVEDYHDKQKRTPLMYSI